MEEIEIDTEKSEEIIDLLCNIHTCARLILISAIISAVLFILGFIFNRMCFILSLMAIVLNIIFWKSLSFYNNQIKSIVNGVINDRTR